MANVKVVYIQNHGDHRIGDQVTIDEADAAELAAKQIISMSTRWGHEDANTVADLIPAETAGKKVVSIAVTPTGLAVNAGENLPFLVTATLANGTTENMTDLEWVGVSEGAEFATVTKTVNGLVLRGHAAGTGKVHVNYGGVEVDAAFTVS
jgi:hypothetical protein